MEDLDIYRFDLLTKDMDLPDSKRHDWAWLLRHMQIRNSSHPNFEVSYGFVKSNMYPAYHAKYKLGNTALHFQKRKWRASFLL